MAHPALKHTVVIGVRLIVLVVVSDRYRRIRVGELGCLHGSGHRHVRKLVGLVLGCKRRVFDGDLLMKGLDIEWRSLDWDRFVWMVQSVTSKLLTLIDEQGLPSSGTGPSPASSRDSFLTRASSLMPPQQVRIDFHSTRRSYEASRPCGM